MRTTSSGCPGGCSQAILEVKMLDVEVLGWCGFKWSVVASPVGCTTQFSETPLETASLQFMNNSSDINSCSQHANCTLPQNLRHLWHCTVLCDKTAHFRVAFYCGQPKGPYTPGPTFNAS